MPLATVFATIMFFGGLALCGALCAIFLASHRVRHQAILSRLSGLAHETNENETASPDLRRQMSMPLWLRMLPQGLGEALSALRAELRSSWILLALSCTGLIALSLQGLLHLPLLMGLAAAAVTLLIAGIWFAKQRQMRRRAAIDDAIPEAMDMIVRSLRVGLPIGSAILASGKDLSGPIAEEFAETSARISYGQDVVSALRDMAERCQNPSLRFFAAAVALQATSGGNLAEVLERLGGIARSRQQLRRKIRSITAEAKWSGRFLSAFPLIATATLLSINPDYFSEIAGEPFFKPMLGVVAALLTANIFFMRWLVKVE